MSEIKENRTRNLRYKRPALASMGFDAMIAELDEIEEACVGVRWFADQDDEALINALDGNEEEAWEFKFAFAELEAKVNQLREAMSDNWGYPAQFYETPYYRRYDYCTVALVGNRYRTIGWDADEEDYMSLTRYEEELAETEAGKWLMRLTKKDMISTIGQSVGTLLAFLDLRQSYDYLKATFDILRDENTSMLQQIKAIEAAYEEACCTDWWHTKKEAVERFDRLLEALPDRVWIE